MVVGARFRHSPSPLLLCYNVLMNVKTTDSPTHYSIDPMDIILILSLISNYRRTHGNASLSDFEDFLTSINFSYHWEDDK